MRRRRRTYRLVAAAAGLATVGALLAAALPGERATSKASTASRQREPLPGRPAAVLQRPARQPGAAGRLLRPGHRTPGRRHDEDDRRGRCRVPRHASARGPQGQRVLRHRGRRRHGRRVPADLGPLPRRAHHRGAEQARPGRHLASATTSSTRAPRNWPACRTAAVTRPPAATRTRSSRAPTSPTSRRTSSTRRPASRSSSRTGCGRRRTSRSASSASPWRTPRVSSPPTASRA